MTTFALSLAKGLRTGNRRFPRPIAPDVVFIGDSITAGGRSFNDVTSINLATNGLQTYQVAANLSMALAYRPQHVVVMAGTNDAIEGPIDRREIQGLWEHICAEARVVVTLVPPSRSSTLNAKLDELNVIAREVCNSRNRPVISLAGLRGPDGLIQEQYTTDGVHLTPAAYAVWRAELRNLGL
jgi:lysophospholipase L1-like esterase